MKNFFISILASLVCVSTHAASYVVPFNNVLLNPGQSLTAGYAFQVSTSGNIFCFTPDFATVGLIQWPYRGGTSSGSLPIILTTNIADSSGTLSIKNTSSTPILASCAM